MCWREGEREKQEREREKTRNGETERERTRDKKREIYMMTKPTLNIHNRLPPAPSTYVNKPACHIVSQPERGPLPFAHLKLLLHDPIRFDALYYKLYQIYLI